MYDLQMAYADPAAAATADHVRYLWRGDSGERLTPPQGSFEPWPEGLPPWLRDIPAGLSRTLATEGVREIEAMAADAIRSARCRIYIETLYFTARAVREALSELLARAEGPEVVVVADAHLGGWLERRTMGRNRDRLMRHLVRVDRYGRLGLYHPHLPEGAVKNVMLHSKLLIVDDELVKIGSANLNNRSMGQDSKRRCQGTWSV